MPGVEHKGQSCNAPRVLQIWDILRTWGACPANEPWHPHWGCASPLLLPKKIIFYQLPSHHSQLNRQYSHRLMGFQTLSPLFPYSKAETDPFASTHGLIQCIEQILQPIHKKNYKSIPHTPQLWIHYCTWKQFHSHQRGWCSKTCPPKG